MKYKPNLIQLFENVKIRGFQASWKQVTKKKNPSYFRNEKRKFQRRHIVHILRNKKENSAEIPCGS